MDNLRLQYFEGPDGSGKTTRIKEILPSFNVYWHNGVYPSLYASHVAYIDQLSYLNQQPLQTGILDRGIFSDAIYGHICRDEVPSQQNIDIIVNMMLSIGTQLVICLPPRHICMENWAERAALGKEYNTDTDKQHRIYDSYCMLIENSPLPTIVYDYTQGK